jgi:hypothetical protein
MPDIVSMALMLKLASSPIFGFGAHGGFNSVHKAIAALGLEKTINLIGLIHMADCDGAFPRFIGQICRAATRQFLYNSRQSQGGAHDRKPRTSLHGKRAGTLAAGATPD